MNARLRKEKKTSKSTACRYVARRSKEKVRVTAKRLQKSGSGLPEPAGTEPEADGVARGFRTHSLANIHERYDQVLQTTKENRCSMACAIRLAGCPRGRFDSRFDTGVIFLACVADETKPRYSPSANQRPKACSAPRVLPVLSIIGSNWLLHMAVLSCTVIGRVDVVEPWLRSR